MCVCDNEVGLGDCYQNDYLFFGFEERVYFIR